ncbi:MAG: hypothetical protein K2X03_11955 [Bryobacteraceae bacterium]|nr:hypothetical protein [Bryobacteraceae bacterium]
MSNENDEEFVLYLRQFRPLAPPPARYQRPPVWFAAAAALLVAASLVWLFLRPVADPAAGPLTLRAAQAAVVGAESWDDLLTRLEPPPPVYFERSAFTILSKETIKP